MEPERQAADDAVVTVKFVTRLPAEFRVPENPIVSDGAPGICSSNCSPMHAARMAQHLPPPLLCLQAVPANLTRYGLSQIINHLLALGERGCSGRPVAAAAAAAAERLLLLPWLPPANNASMPSFPAPW